MASRSALDAPGVPISGGMPTDNRAAVARARLRTRKGSPRKR
jgi:hypothetical protein